MVCGPLEVFLLVIITEVFNDFYSDHVCGTYHEGFQSIRRTEEPCNASDNCPYRYKSTDQFKCKF